MKPRIRLLSVWLCIACAPAAPASSQTTKASPAVIDSAALAAFIDPIVTAQLEKEHIPGAVFAFVQNGRILYQRGYGFANVERGQPVDPERTIWRIGSISKVFTATAVVQLADMGRFRLTDDVNRYLADIKVPATFAEPVTFEHLLTHTGGFDEIRPGTRAETQAGLLPLGQFLNNKLVRLRPPGRIISYSTYGITLAGHLVEQVSGLEFEQYLQRNIWRPLGMLRTNITVPDSLRSDLAQGYDYGAMVRNFERDAIALIEKNSDVTFDIYFAPYSILHFVAMRDASPATLKVAHEFAAYAFPLLLQFPNVRLHDFRGVKDVTHDLGNYGDVIHHSPAIDLKILSWLAERKYLVDRAAPLVSLERLKAQVEAYKVDP